MQFAKKEQKQGDLIRRNGKRKIYYVVANQLILLFYFSSYFFIYVITVVDISSHNKGARRVNWSFIALRNIRKVIGTNIKVYVIRSR